MAAEVNVETCVTPARLLGLVPHGSLDVFRPPNQQHEALLEISADRRCCVTIAVQEGTLVGYASFHPPSAIESWGEDRTGELIELGAVEVSPTVRGQRLAERLLAESFGTGRFDATIVFATMYVWHFDLARTGLSDLAYKRLLQRLYQGAGMTEVATSDQEIRSSPANALMARRGPDCPQAVADEFDRLRKRRQEPLHAWQDPGRR